MTLPETLFDLEPGPSGFQMQSFRSAEGAWEPMEDGVAGSHWRPKANREAAVYRCIEWTGLLCIPAMRVVDLSTGDVIWQDRWDRDEEDAHLERIVPAWAEPIYEQVRRDFQLRSAAEAELVAGGVTTDLGAAADDAIREATA